MKGNSFMIRDFGDLSFSVDLASRVVWTVRGKVCSMKRKESVGIRFSDEILDMCHMKSWKSTGQKDVSQSETVFFGSSCNLELEFDHSQVNVTANSTFVL